MQEFWFCASCKSMNRADAKRCYKCRSLKEQATLATVGEKKQGVVLTPGLDDDHREIAWLLMSGRRYISAWRLGYIAGGLMMVALAVWTFNAITFAFYAALLMLNPNGQAASAFDQNLAAIGLLLSLIGLSWPISVILHSVFLGLTSMNSPALGSGAPRFGPIRSALWWIESLGWAVWGVLLLGWPIYAIAMLFIPVYLVASGGILVGTILAIFWFFFVRWAYGELGGPFSALGKPRRLLQDLMDRLGVPESSDSRLVSLWSGAWVTFVGTFYVLLLAPLLLLLVVLLVFLVTSLAGIQLTPAPESQVRVFATLTGVFIATVLLLAYGTLLLATARITLELSRRQRVREEWVRSGTNPYGTGAAAQDPGPRGPVPQPAYQAQPVYPQPGYPQPAYQAPPGYPPPAGFEQQPAPGPLSGYSEPPPWSEPPQPRSAPQPFGEPVAWSRPVGRVTPEAASQTGFEPLRPDDLPPAWLQAIRQAAPPTPSQPTPSQEASEPAPAGPQLRPSGPAGPLEPQPPASDRPVIQPSSSGLPRYRAPLADLEPAPPAEVPPDEPDLGAGI